jgi:hypothetical protein
MKISREMSMGYSRDNDFELDQDGISRENQGRTGKPVKRSGRKLLRN